MAARDRRLGFRVPLEIFLTQYVRDRPTRALSCNLSDTGIFFQTAQIPTSASSRPERRQIGLEFELPGTSEVIWARGEVCYSASKGTPVRGNGIRFTAIPTLHARMIRDYCIEARRAHLGQLLSRIRQPANVSR